MKAFLQKLLVEFGWRALLIASAVGILFIVVARLEAKFDRDKKIIQELANQKIAAAFEQAGAVQGQLIKERVATQLMSKELAAAYAKLKAAGALLDAQSQSKIEISDSTQGGFIGPNRPQPADCKGQWQDEYHRFTLSLPDGPLRRHQLFGLDWIMVRSPDGSVRALKQDFREYDPETKAEIPVAGAQIETHFQFQEIQTSGPGRWHLRWVAAVDTRPAIGLGIQANPVGSLTLGFLGMYKPASPVEGLIGFQLGWRLRFPHFDSTLAVGPWIGTSLPTPRLTGGAAVTIEITR